MMKFIPVALHTGIFKAIFISCIILAPCCSRAQSVAGKWKRTGTILFIKDKATGRQVQASAEMQQQYDQAIAANGYTELLELKADNTYVSTVSTASGGKPMVHNGNYSRSGNDLDMQVPLINNQKTTITIHSLTGDTMVWDHLFMGKLTRIIYSRL
jgi:hypothetical protein